MAAPYPKLGEGVSGALTLRHLRCVNNAAVEGVSGGSDMRSVRQFTRRVSALCFLAIVTVFAVAPAGGAAQDRTALLLRQLIFQIPSVSSPELRETMAKDLATVMLYLSGENKLQTAIDDSVIDRLAELLSDDSDAVRYWVAASLGTIGPRAVRAVPALEEALRRVEDYRRSYLVGPSSDSKQFVLMALEAITGEKRLSH